MPDGSWLKRSPSRKAIDPAVDVPVDDERSNALSGTGSRACINRSRASSIVVASVTYLANCDVRADCKVADVIAFVADFRRMDVTLLVVLGNPLPESFSSEVRVFGSSRTIPAAGAHVA